MAKIATSFCAVLAMVSACSLGKTRSGELASLADSALPPRIDTRCYKFPEAPVGGDAAPNVACQATVHDTLVTIVQPEHETRVVRVTRVWRPAASVAAAYDSALLALSAHLGAGQSICSGSHLDPAQRWDRGSVLVTLHQVRATRELDLTYSVYRPGFSQSCDSN